MSTDEAATGLPTSHRDDAEQVALEAAVAEARADHRPPIPHERIRQEMQENVARAEERIAILKAHRKAS